jgi:hypothetical protein
MKIKALYLHALYLHAREALLTFFGRILKKI